MVGRRLRRLAALAILVNSIAFAGLTNAGPSPVAAGDDRFAGMPTPEALAVPTSTTALAASTMDATLSQPTARLRPASYVLRQFDSAGNVVRKRSLTLSSARVFDTLASERTFGGRRYIKLTSGQWAGWWVPARATTATAHASLTSAVAVTAPRGKLVGRRFFGPVTTRRVLWLPAAATYRASDRAQFNGRLHYLLGDGPLAGRWVSAASVTTGGSSDSGTPTSSPVAPSPTPTAAPTARPSATPTATPTAAPPAATWKAIALIYRETDVTFRRSDGSSYRLQARMNDEMYELVRSTLGRTLPTVAGWSAGSAAMELTIVDVPHPLDRVDELGSAYWVGPQTIEADLDAYAPTGSYDSIFVVFHPRDQAGVEIPIGGWGLTVPGGWWSNGAGFTSVITPAAAWWWTESAVPEEVFIHEWLHQVLFFHQDAGRISLDLHAGRDYGYDDPDGTWKAWYSDIMQGRVPNGTATIGLTREIWAAGQPTNP